MTRGGGDLRALTSAGAPVPMGDPAQSPSGGSAGGANAPLDLLRGQLRQRSTYAASRLRRPERPAAAMNATGRSERHTRVTG